jgi:hypothetical protein
LLRRRHFTSLSISQTIYIVKLFPAIYNPKRYNFQKFIIHYQTHLNPINQLIKLNCDTYHTINHKDIEKQNNLKSILRPKGKTILL